MLSTHQQKLAIVDGRERTRQVLEELLPAPQTGHLRLNSADFTELLWYAAVCSDLAWVGMRIVLRAIDNLEDASLGG